MTAPTPPPAGDSAPGPRKPRTGGPRKDKGGKPGSPSRAQRKAERAAEALAVAAADVNRDGMPDLISANKNDDTLTVLTNNGSTFGAKRGDRVPTATKLQCDVVSDVKECDRFS